MPVLNCFKVMSSIVLSARMRLLLRVGFSYSMSAPTGLLPGKSLI